MIEQTQITLEARPRGFHLVTDEVLAGAPDLGQVEAGLLHLWIRHTSASLTVNENASPDVRRDFESWANDAVPRGRRRTGPTRSRARTTCRPTSRPR